MASDIWLRTILIVRKETRYRHIGYSYRLTARVLLYAPSHRQDSTYHGLCYTSRGALAGTRNSSMGPPNEGSIRRPTAPWANALPLSYVPLLVDDYLLVKFSVKMGNDEHRCWSFLVHEPDVDLAHFLWELLPALSRRLARQVFDVFKGRVNLPLTRLWARSRRVGDVGSVGRDGWRGCYSDVAFSFGAICSTETT